MPITLLSPTGRVVVGYDLRVEVRKGEGGGGGEERQSREGWGDKKKRVEMCAGHCHFLLQFHSTITERQRGYGRMKGSSVDTPQLGREESLR